MFDSKLHIQGLSLEEVIQQGVTGYLSGMTTEDWKYLENMYGYEYDIKIETAYGKGYSAGEDSVWNMILNDEED